MPYYETLAQDLERAKDILQKGREEHRIPQSEGRPDFVFKGCTIWSVDMLAAYKLLESFVEAIEEHEGRVRQAVLSERARCLGVVRRMETQITED